MPIACSGCGKDQCVTSALWANAGSLLVSAAAAVDSSAAATNIQHEPTPSWHHLEKRIMIICPRLIALFGHDFYRREEWG